MLIFKQFSIEAGMQLPMTVIGYLKNDFLMHYDRIFHAKAANNCLYIKAII
jgi:hypothetical protein